METATLAGGCFWCTEAIFKRLKGVKSVTPGYSGGSLDNPTYEQVCSGTTGHAEAIKIKFDPKIIPYEKLLEVFFALHDTTTLNQQGNDFGTQYRSAIFYHDDNQKKSAQKVKERIEKSHPEAGRPLDESHHKQSLRSSPTLRGAGLKNPIVTEITPFKNFYKAENYHQNYFDNNRTQPYCQLIIDPKIKKLYEEFGGIIKED